MGVRIPVDDSIQDRGDNARFSRSRGTDDAEMLAQQLIRENIGRYDTILVDRPDPSRGGVGTRINLRKIDGGGKVNGLIQCRVRGHSAAKKACAVCAPDLADQLELDQPQILLGGLQAGQRDSETGDHAVNG